MISYAQNFEDVMLWRALKHIENGFYIDVGAWSPDLDSVTRAFYENGWRGINVEPNPEFHLQYLDKRVHDINLKVAVSNIVGETDIYFSTNPGLSSLNQEIAEGHKKIGWDVIPSKTKVTTLIEIFSEYCHNKEVHFLKVDIEGYEKQALLGNDWNRFRPWIVVVEATLPMTQVENHDEWEYILLEANYLFVYADGLNRFYVAEEHSELKASFAYPPNVFDGFVLASQVYSEQSANEASARATQAEAKATTAEQSANEASARATQAEAKATTAEQSANEASARATQAEQQLALLLNSRSWKITKPLRTLGDIARRLVKGIVLLDSVKTKMKSLIKKVIVKLKNFINRHPKIKMSVLKVLNNFPSLKTRLKRIGSSSTIDNSKFKIQNLKLNHLSPQAKKIYFDLKNAIEQRKNEVQK